MAVTEVVLYPDDWDKLTDAARTEYTASAAEHRIALSFRPSATTKPDQLLTVSDGDPKYLAVPYFFGPVRCDRARWEHNLRELLDMDDPCFPNLGMST